MVSDEDSRMMGVARVSWARGIGPAPQDIIGTWRETDVDGAAYGR